MNIHEYQAKEILGLYGASVSKGVVILEKENINSSIDNFDAELYVVKAQIHAGGRGKAGGVKLAKNKEEAKKLANEMWHKLLITPQTGPEGKIVQRLYIESGSNIAHEYYFSLIVDRESAGIICIVSTEGGVDIEEVAHTNPEKVHQIYIDPVIGLSPFHLRKIAKCLEIKEGKSLASLFKNIESCYKMMIEKDASQIEVNPLILKDDGEFLILDAKVSFDDNALFRHKDVQNLRDESEEDPLETRAQKHELNYVRMDGEIGCMVNGAGLAMATMDIIQLYGAKPANFLDVGGGATEERVTEALSIILSDTNVKAVLVNIFGGIMRCDIIANGIVGAAKKIGLKVPLVVRLAGTNFALGKEILAKSNLPIIAADDLADAAEKIVNIVK
ncbi:MAG: ADP-forming succinate--CoA ligase subunit beta [Rickettsiaceae bacterium]|nr:ADP-forming succinate--CoA ligase subunit beta [Rickettsiaceae bacterium]